MPRREAESWQSRGMQSKLGNLTARNSDRFYYLSWPQPSSMKQGHPTEINELIDVEY